MTIVFGSKGRQVIPRWRDSLSAIQHGEVRPLDRAEPRSLADAARLQRLTEEWTDGPTLSVAAELVGEASLSGTNTEAIVAARYVLENAPPATSHDLVSLAKRLLVPDDLEQPFAAWGGVDREEPAFRKRIRDLRKSLRSYPRNALGWADLAHAYAAIGAVTSAIYAMNVALKIADADRYLIRSAARLFLHAREPDRALSLLRKSHSQRDPWLTAAEIAVSGMEQLDPKFISVGRKMIESRKLAPFHKSELVSAIGTLEAESGAGKVGKKLFKQSLIDPTENAVAQAEWAANNLVRFEVPREHLQRPDSYEARTIDAFQNGDFATAYKDSWRWLLDQPFTVEPARDGSFFASVGLEDHEAALRIIAYAEAANPRDWLLLNNKAFAFLSLNQVKEAEQALSLFRPDRGSAQQYGTWLATTGMLHFRKKDLETGRKLYQQSVEVFENESRSKAIASIFWAREEMIAASQPNWEAAFTAAMAAMKRAEGPDIALWGGRLIQMKQQIDDIRSQLDLAGAER